MLPDATKPTATAERQLTYTHDPRGNLTDRTWALEGDPSAVPPSGMTVSHSHDTATNRIQTAGFAYDLNGNQTRMAGGFVPAMAATWDALDRVTAIYNGQPDAGTPGNHRVTERYVYDASGMRLLSFPDGGNGLPVLTLRDGMGQVVSEFVLDPSTGNFELAKDFVYGLGRLLVERRVIEEAPVVQAGVPLIENGSYVFNLIEGSGAPSYTVDIRSATGHLRQLTGVTAAGNKIVLAESEFSLGEVNHIRVRPEGGEAPFYSAPVTLAIDPTVTSQSANQVRAVTVSRVGTDVLVSFSLLQSNNKKTYVYFENGETSQPILQTPSGLQAGVTSYVIKEQSLSASCGEIYTQQSSQNSIGSALPTVDLAQNPGSSGAECGGAPEPPAYLFADVYHHRDHLGSLRVATDAAGWTVGGHDYYPFGMAMDAAGGMGPSGSASQYTGHERDALTDADYITSFSSGVQGA